MELCICCVGAVFLVLHCQLQFAAAPAAEHWVGTQLY